MKQKIELIVPPSTNIITRLVHDVEVINSTGDLRITETNGRVWHIPFGSYDHELRKDNEFLINTIHTSKGDVK